MNEIKKISEGDFSLIVNEALQNPPLTLASSDVSLQDKRDAAMWNLLRQTRVWCELEFVDGPVQGIGTLSQSYGYALMSLLDYHSEPSFNAAKYLKNYMRALFGDKAFKD
jgi:hypothetical protein